MFTVNFQTQENMWQKLLLKFAPEKMYQLVRYFFFGLSSSFLVYFLFSVFYKMSIYKVLKNYSFVFYFDYKCEILIMRNKENIQERLSRK